MDRLKIQRAPDGSGVPGLEVVQEDAAPGIRVRQEGTSGNAFEVVGASGAVLWSVTAAGSAPALKVFNVLNYGALRNGTYDDALAIAAAIAACQAAGGGIVYAPAGVYTCKTAPYPASSGLAPFFILGDGPAGSQYGHKDGTTFYFPTDLGAGVIAFDFSNSFHAGGMQGITMQGPNTGPALAAQTMQCIGIRFGPRIVLRDVNVIGGFLHGIEQYGDHAKLINVKSGTGNYMGLYYPTGAPTHGDNLFIGCDFAGCSYASVGVHPNNSCDGENFYSTHFGFSPYGFYKEGPTGTNGGFIQNTYFSRSPVESWGNAAFYDATGAAIWRSVRGQLSTPTFDATYTYATDGIRRGWLDVQTAVDVDFDVGDLTLFPQYAAGTAAHVWLNGASQGVIIRGAGFSASGVPVISGGATNYYGCQQYDTNDSNYGRTFFPNSAVTAKQVLEIINSSGFPKVQTAVSASGKPLAGVARSTQSTHHVTCTRNGLLSVSSFTPVADSAITCGDLVTPDGVTTAGRVKTVALAADRVLGMALNSAAGGANVSVLLSLS